MSEVICKTLRTNGHFSTTETLRITEITGEEISKSVPSVILSASVVLLPCMANEAAINMNLYHSGKQVTPNPDE
jgi:hypothetical protein